MNSPFALLCRVTLLAAASLAGLLRAQTYVIDSNISDWGINATTLISSTARSQYIEDFVGAGGFVGPQYGGQTYDAEAIYLDWNSSRVFVGVLTGMPPTHTNYSPADILFDFNYSPIDANLASTSTPDFALVVNNYSGLTVGNFYQGTTWANAQVSTSYVVAVKTGTVMSTLGSGANNVAFSYSTTGMTGLGSTPADTHYFIEASIPVSAFGSFWNATGPTQPVEVRWSMYCGNDFISTVVVPEPSTVAGIGLMLGGLFFARRFRGLRAAEARPAA